MDGPPLEDRFGIGGVAEEEDIDDHGVGDAAVPQAEALQRRRRVAQREIEPAISLPRLVPSRSAAGEEVGHAGVEYHLENLQEEVDDDLLGAPGLGARHCCSQSSSLGEGPQGYSRSANLPLSTGRKDRPTFCATAAAPQHKPDISNRLGTGDEQRHHRKEDEDDDDDDDAETNENENTGEEIKGSRDEAIVVIGKANPGLSKPNPAALRLQGEQQTGCRGGFHNLSWKEKRRRGNNGNLAGEAAGKRKRGGRKEERWGVEQRLGRSVTHLHLYAINLFISLYTPLPE